MLRSEDGTVTVEMVIMLPFFIWAIASSLVFFDSFRANAVNTRTSYTIGDALSRETAFISPRYMDSLAALQGFLLATDEDRTLRVTVVRYQSNRDRHRVVWSEVRGDGAVGPMTDGEALGYHDRIPVTNGGGRMIVVESWVDHTPAFEVGVGAVDLYDIAVTRPRFAGQLCWNDSEDGDVDTMLC